MMAITTSSSMSVNAPNAQGPAGDGLPRVLFLTHSAGFMHDVVRREKPDQLAFAEARMVELAPLFEGEHDFSAFAASDERDEAGGSKVRTIFSSRAERAGERLLYRVRGSGFLKHMVRNLVGTLLEAGKGNLGNAVLFQHLRRG